MNQPALIDGSLLAPAVYGQVQQFPRLADKTYVLISPTWLDGEFASSFYDFLQMFGLLDWQAESNDCDKFSGWAGSVATALHARTRRKFNHAPSALAFGQWFYYPEWAGGQGHAINWFAYGVPVDESHPEGIAVGFYEPDGRKRHVVKLSEKEINSCFNCTA